MPRQGRQHSWDAVIVSWTKTQREALEQRGLQRHPRWQDASADSLAGSRNFPRIDLRTVNGNGTSFLRPNLEMRRTTSNITTSSDESPLTNASEETGEKTMKAIHGGATKRTFGIFIFLASL